ncbi:MAG: DNA gyrase subunit A [Chloroflexota bacterium]
MDGQMTPNNNNQMNNGQASNGHVDGMDNQDGTEAYAESYAESYAEDGETVLDPSSLNGHGALNGVQDPNIGVVRPIAIVDEMRASYLDYAMSVIVSRALPDARDGLKPVHRRILYAMHDMGLQPNTSYKKSARIVGEVLGKYHPHGDTAVYDAMARMAQDFSLRYPLVDGQGNFGSIDGDSPAAMRYTEARLARIAATMLRDIDMDTVDWGNNFDDSLLEPEVLPAMLPNLLVNGTSGIAVGMATNIPPHNLNEVANAIVHVIDNWDRRNTIGLEELMTFVKGPDFPTGGIILGNDGIKQAFATGRGRVLVRSKTEIEEMNSGRFRIIVTELPYQVNKSLLIERMAELVRHGKIDMISDIRDESDRKGMRLVIELKRGVAPKKASNTLFKHTALQNSFGVNALALENGQPVTLSLRKSLIIYIDHRQEVLERRTQFQLAKARERAHILEGLRIALQFLDEVIQTIRSSESADAARSALMERFGLSQVQSQAILDMQLRRLAALERQRIEDEYAEVMVRIAYLEDLLAHPEKIRALVREDIIKLKEDFGDERRTMILAGASGSFNDEDLITQENVLISFSAGSYIKRMLASDFRAQNRGGRGVKGMATRQEDEVINLIFGRTLDHVLFFTNKGRIYSSRVYELPEGSRTSRGAHIANVLSLQPDEDVTTMLVFPDYDFAQYVTLITRQGRIKRMDLSSFSNVRVSGINAMNLDSDDSLDWAQLTNGEDEFIIVSRRGKALRIHEETVRVMGRAAGGVMAMRLAEDDEVIGLEVAQSDRDLLIMHERGWGKRVSLDEYSARGRYTQGNWTTDHRRLDEVGAVVSARIVHPDDQITVITSNGIVMRTDVSGISSMGRYTRGVRVVKLQNDDSVAAVAVLRHEDLAGDGEEDGDANGETAGDTTGETTGETTGNTDGEDQETVQNANTVETESVSDEHTVDIVSEEIIAEPELVS